MIDLCVSEIKGVGPKTVAKLNVLGIYTIDDLINYFPTKYDDRRKLNKIADCTHEEKVLIKIRIVDITPIRKVNRQKSIFKIRALDSTGFVDLIFFNQEYFYKKLSKGDIYYAYGRCKNQGSLEITNPDMEHEKEINKTGKISPIYGLTKELSNNQLIKIISFVIDNYFEKIEDVIPTSIKESFNLYNKKDAVRYLHFPKDGATYALAKKTIAFEKLMILQIGLLSIKNRLDIKSEGISFQKTSDKNKLVESLPYELTNAQKRVLKEIEYDMASSKPMNRLVQGDVGSGKTIVAIAAMLVAVESGYQTSMMAPTEILAHQHYQTITEYLETCKINVKVEFLAGSTTKKNKAEILKRVKSGETQILIGTHALIEKNVEFNNIGLAITDEQHRFGVRQRALLSNKGKNPDILVMTATPIPRTLALMIYGDLDISLIDEMPPNRQIIITNVLSKGKKDQAFDFIKEEIIKGRQAYIVAPLVEESEKLELDSATKIFNELKDKHFKDFSIGLLHGKMANSEKDDIMKKFYCADIQILVSTTVIEVGVNVPNATVMMILNAERFGLAQLHQLRGRVGRGKNQSYCMLVNESKSENSRSRMQILAETNNGFLIAEEDLKIRGPGDFFGMRQHGVESYNLDKLISDLEQVKMVQETVKIILDENPRLEGEEYSLLKMKIMYLFKNENIVFN